MGRAAVTKGKCSDDPRRHRREQGDRIRHGSAIGPGRRSRRPRSPKCNSRRGGCGSIVAGGSRGEQSGPGRVLDVTDTAQVRSAATQVGERFGRLDVLVNNAAVYTRQRTLTEDGLETQFAVNHLAPFLLTNLLLERLVASAPSRIVTVSSGAQSMGRIDFDDLMAERAYSGERAYNQSKLANVMFTYELAKRLEGTAVTATALHPGMTNTAFSAEDPSLGRLVRILRPFMQSPAKGADTAVYLASSPEVEGMSGGYYAKRKLKGSHESSSDTVATARLWRVSAHLVGLTTDAA
jgi:retinol dehydrogenase 14